MLKGIQAIGIFTCDRLCYGGNGMQTLGRALDILFALAEAGTILSVGEIAEKVSIPESTAYRQIQTLEKHGILERKGKGQIALGLRILDLARSLHHQMDRELYTIARPIMENLTNETEETSILMVRAGHNVLCILQIESKRLVRFAIENGRILPMHLGASGKAILAFEEKKTIDKVLSQPEVDNRKKLLEQLAEIRQLGYSITSGEVDQDVFAIAAPIYDSYDRVIASLTISGPKYRFTDDLISPFVEATLKATHSISQKLHQLSSATKQG